MDKLVKLIAKDDTDIVNVFGVEKHIKKGEELQGTVKTITDTFKLVTIEVYGYITPYDIDVVKDKFYIKELEN